MTTATLFQKCDFLKKNLQIHTEILQREKSNFFEKTESILIQYDDALRQLKSWVQDHSFKTWEEEIRFFKTIKPQFTSPFIYHSKLLSTESGKPYGDDHALKLFYEKELAALTYFFSEHQEFIRYYRRNATYMDRKYFLRHHHDLKMWISADYHNYDHRFSTSHDMTVAAVIAYDELEKVFKSKISCLQTDYPTDPFSKPKQLDWTASKSGLTELLAALHYTQCFNGGRTEFSEVVRWAEASLNIDLGNYHKTIGELRARKNDRTKFLNMLVESLNKHFTDLDA